MSMPVWICWLTRAAALREDRQVQEALLSPSNWFTVNLWQHVSFTYCARTLCVFDSCSVIQRALLLLFLSMGSSWGRWKRSPGGLAAESNSFAPDFWLCADGQPHPVSGAYMSVVAGGGQATVRCCISCTHTPHPPEFYSLCEVSLRLSRTYPFLMPLSVCVREEHEARSKRDSYTVDGSNVNIFLFYLFRPSLYDTIDQCKETKNTLAETNFNLQPSS